LTVLLRFENVACWRGGRLLFEGLSFTLEPGDALWVRGPNGIGKSSLLRLAAGLLRPAAGTVQAAPAALADDALALDRELPLEAALGFWARLDASSGGLPDAVTAMGLQHLRMVPVRMLSTGQLRRARLARVVASGAPLWLLDEPLNGLDEAGADQLGAALDRQRKEGGAVLAASHAPLLGRRWRTLDLAG
jgi:heme exporter protein A